MQGARPARLVGFVLIGVAVVAVGIGVFALTGNGSPQSQGRPPVVSGTTAPATTTTKSAGTTTTTQQGPTTTYPKGQTTTVAPPPTTATSQTLEQTVPVRVYNNSKIKNLAAIAGQDFTAAGFDVVQTGNYDAGIIPVSTAYYSPLPGEQQIANELGRDFNLRVLPRFEGIAAASPGVIVIVTKNFQGGK